MPRNFFKSIFLLMLVCVFAPAVSLAQTATSTGDGGCTGVSLSLANGKTSYVQGEMVNYTYACTPTGSSGYVEIQVSKPDGSHAVYNYGTSSGLTLGFGTSNLVPGSYVIWACNAAGCPTITASAPFTVTAPTSVPPAPAGLTATLANNAASNSTVNLIWTGNTTNITSFRIYQHLQGSNWSSNYDTRDTSSLIGNTGTSITAQVSVYWAGSGTYEFKVQACNSAGCSGDSNTATVAIVNTDTTAPSAPTGLVATKDSANEVDLSWTASTDNVGVANYLVYRSYNAVWSQVGQTNSPSYNDYTVSPSTSYYYAVVAYDLAGNRSATSSPPLFLNTPAATSTSTTTVTPPAAPTNLTATVSGSNVTLNWTDNSNNDAGFKMYRGPVWTDIGNVGANVNTFTDSNLAAGTYYYHLNAWATGSSSPVWGGVSNDVTVTVSGTSSGGGGSGSAPVVTINADGTAGSVDRVAPAYYTLFWSVSGGATSCNANGTWSGSKATSTSSQSFSGVTVLGIKTYSLTCSNSAGSGTATVNVNIVASTTTSGTVTPPAAPTNLTATVSGSNVTLNWTDNSNNDAGFKMYRCPVWTDIGNVGANVNTFTDSNLAAGTYYYHLNAWATGSSSPVWGGVSNDVTVTVSTSGSDTGTSGGGGGSTTTNAPPDNIQFYLMSGNQLKISWRDNSWNEDIFKIERMLNEGALVTLQPFLPANTTSTIVDAGLPGTYKYTIFACPTGSACLVSATVTFILPSGTGSGTSSTTNITSATTTTTTNTTATTTSYTANTTNTNAPSDLKLSYSNGKIRLEWKDNSAGRIPTKIEKMFGNSFFATLNTVPAGQTYYEDFVGSQGHYEYQLAACPVGQPCIFGSRAGIDISYFQPKVEIFADGYGNGIKRINPAYYNISWKVQNNASKCLAEGAWTGDKDLAQGSQDFRSVTVLGPKTYTLTCYNSAGSSSASVTVDVVSAEVLSTTASTTLTQGASLATVKEGMLTGKAEDGEGNPLANVPIHIFTKDFAFSTGNQSDSNGIFKSYLPPGTYIVEAFMPSGRTDIFRPAIQEVVIYSGTEKLINLKFVSPSKTVTGTVKYYTGELVGDAKVGAYSSQSGQWTYADVGESGNYNLKLGPGSWQLKVFPRDSSAASWQSGTAVQEIYFAANALGEIRTVNFVILLSSSRVKVKVLNSLGMPAGKVGLVLDTVSTSRDSAATNRPAPVFRSTDDNGEAEFMVPPRTYFLRAQLPPDSEYLPPEEEKFDLLAGDAKQVSLKLKSRSATETVQINGLAKLENGKPVDAFIWGWFEKGGQVQVRAKEDGTFSFSARPNNRLHIGAGKELDGYAYKTSDIVLDIGNISPAGQVELVLAKIVSAQIAPPVTVSQSASEEVVVQSQDGARVNIPANTVSGGGEINVKMNPTIEAPSQGAAKLVGTAYDVNVEKPSGENIKSFAQEIEVSIPYDEESIKKQGLSLETVIPSYYDDSTGSWVKVDKFIINKSKKVFVLKVSHLTRFALVAAADTTPPLSPDNVKAIATGSGEVVLAWKNPTKDFDHVKIYRSVDKSSLGAIVLNDYAKQEYKDGKEISNGTTYYYVVRSVDPAGNESTNYGSVAVVAKGSSSASGKIKSNLKLGMRSSEVKTMQQVLIQEGFLASDSATGYFGNMTKAALIKFQDKYKNEILAPAGLVSGNGFVGSLTRAKINSLLP